MLNLDTQNRSAAHRIGPFGGFDLDCPLAQKGGFDVRISDALAFLLSFTGALALGAAYICMTGI